MGVEKRRSVSGARQGGRRGNPAGQNVAVGKGAGGKVWAMGKSGARQIPRGKRGEAGGLGNVKKAPGKKRRRENVGNFGP